MSTDLEKTPIWADIRKVLNSGPKDVRYEYTATIHTVIDDIDSMKVITIDYIRNYVTNISDEVFIELIMPLGEYIKRLYPYRDNLEITVNRTVLNEAAETHSPNKTIDTERYKAIFLPSNPSYKAHEYDNIDKHTLDHVDILHVKFQLLNRALEPLRIKTTGAIFRNVSQKDIIHAVLAGESMKVLIDGKPSIDGLSLVEPDNTEIKKHVIIPQGTHVTGVPTYLHEKMNGVYNAGIGTYLQAYKDKRMWFVYPLYNTKRFADRTSKAIFYSVPRNRYPSIERTYRLESDTIHILATGNKVYNDLSDTTQIDSGIGFRMTDARAMMKKPVGITPDGPVGLRTRLNTEVAISSRSDGLNYAPIARDSISSNPFIEYSNCNRKNGSIMDLVWDNANPGELYPGMPCKYTYMENDILRELYGVIHSVHVLVQLDGRGISSRSHITTAHVSLFLERLTTLPNSNTTL